MEFRTIVGFEGHEVSREGVVRNSRTKEVYNILLAHNKYKSVSITKDGKTRKLSIPTIIRKAFNPIFDLDGEIWLPIQDYPNYEISNMGRIQNMKGCRILKQNFDQHENYYQVCLCHKNEKSTFMVHHLVAKTFIPNPNNLPIIDHIDINKQNNKAANLRWVTWSQNGQNKEGRGRSPYLGVCISVRPYGSYISAMIQGTYIGSYDTEEEAARAYDARAREIFGETARLNFP